MFAIYLLVGNNLNFGIGSASVFAVYLLVGNNLDNTEKHNFFCRTLLITITCFEMVIIDILCMVCYITRNTNNHF